ncbi:FAD-dependent 2-octaprenylphenol hydroxylase [Vibrio natriegens]|uniref:FAD-dependent 2-octaprenylphenol hydroxylase n=1 Tax=Vibrio natriegens NBRC 15636 = ATCC 14048 = DSM 759 TaxID=1219067 RepID=A0AAN0Y411_VIBNA|nr:FAD-dependent 2-octaprenylphenol hydroxylase [Vibrio natriegens]ALR14619.1 oxidoreductase [Vibrio natriegens NBRC 15636 = ATCC 14048 = DSM 759]ANQ13516.1 FAD-dependent 2-octaprenylphenol hydroxylase [Vibrio natriegens NBRC 15636 = ATCC 14048 = DSM 759]EPM41409.1 2-octaprenyl-6-methoxyphenyl hydroxylase [Vibrio natriegens NBRC 15636 = ATCC 14048 = DSM 759]MDX6027959.1 FAD-dependent 2-octaprenylphenol hydroxylase [Vibrio natriegens NBRC 15636 = ATCC 14048 = DSM 759]UUI11259.1 FAD-dependent 2-
MMQSVDIAIIGGGMVGLALAAAFKDSDLRIAVIEGSVPDDKLNELPDVRVSALSRSSETILRKLGAWQGIEQRRASPYYGMEVWEQDSFAKIEFDAQSMAQPDLGHIVENRVIQLALLEQVEKQDNVTLFMPARCATLAVGEQESWLTLDNGQAMTAKLVVGADGANSWLRRQMDIPLTHWDYGHSALVANVKTAEPHNHIARQIFTPHGPLALLPMSQPNMCSIVWSTEPDRAEHLLAMDEHEFNKALTSEFDARLGLCGVVGARAAFPLKMRYARDFVVERVALVGDAAHTIHPLAGQGVNLGLLDAASLAQEVLALWNQGQDIGSKRNLRSYERWRKAESAKMIAAMQGFRDLFSGENPAKKLIRGIGLSLAGQLPGAKDEIMKRALGLKGDLPELARQ